MAEWFSIEVLNGSGYGSARGWADAFGDSLAQAALAQRASDWNWHHHSWGSVFEVELPSEEDWDSFRALAAVRAALDAVPDPVNGLIVYRGRGGSSPAGKPRRPRPLAGAGAASLPLPVDDEPDLMVPVERRWFVSSAGAGSRGAHGSGARGAHGAGAHEAGTRGARGSPPRAGRLPCKRPSGPLDGDGDASQLSSRRIASGVSRHPPDPTGSTR